MGNDRELNKFPGYDNDCFSVRMQSKSGNMFTPTHYHDCVEILYCMEGSFQAHVQEVPYALHVGDMLVVYIDEPHNLYPTGCGDNRYLVVKFSLDVLHFLSQSPSETAFLRSFSVIAMRAGRFFSAETLQPSPVPEMMENMIRESREKDFGYELALRAEILRLFLWILRAWRIHTDSDAWPDSGIEVIPTLKKTFSFVEYHYREPITMETVADSLNMNYYAFSRFFTRHTGYKFTEYLNHARLKMAKTLLSSTAKSIAEISEEVGYTSTSYFIKRFREENGMTPQQYRALLSDSRL